MKPDPRFVLSDAEARRVAEEFGTPCYVLDEASFRSRLRRYRAAFEAAWPNCKLSFASKANSILRALAIAHEEGYGIDVASEGEFRAALAAGVPAESCHLHGNAKNDSELTFAITNGIGQIVVDNFAELGWLSRQTSLGATQLVLRLTPSATPKTHQAISTGQADTKFGFNIGDGSAERAVEHCLRHHLPLIGFHCHVGSQLLDPEAQIAGGRALARFAIEMASRHGFRAELLNVGGGLGAQYHAKESPMPLEDYCRLIAAAVREELQGSGLEPALAQEPGRSVIAEAGVTLYRVQARKTVPAESGSKTYLSVDGGLSDNPRPVMYDAVYEVHAVGQEGDLAPFTISGKHCETDTLVPLAYLPEATREGDLLQFLCTGAYNASMASNYNRFLRPPTILRTMEGGFTVIQRRETWDQLFARE